MVLANVGALGVKPGNRALVEILTRANPELASPAGCLLYEVGVNDDEPDCVFVIELWESAEAHQVSLQLNSVRASVAEAKLLLSGKRSGSVFSIAGSPFRNAATDSHAT